MMGTFTTDVRWIVCPGCKKEVLVHWSSFFGCGKKCPGCKQVIFYNWDDNKLHVKEPAR